jgi:hypothetical protein
MLAASGFTLPAAKSSLPPCLPDPLSMLASTEIELAYNAYQLRQLHEVSPAGLKARVERIEPGNKFMLKAGVWSPQPYAGHAVVAMVDGAQENAPLLDQLRSIQNQLSYNVCDPSTLCFLPEASFHQTLANTLSAERHQRYVVDRGLAASYPAQVTSVFEDLPPSLALDRLSMRMVGLSLFSNAIGLLGTFDREDDFHRVLHFREHFYGHERIGLLGIRRTRPFIGHITLAYVERPLDAATKARLVEVAEAINRLLATRNLRFYLPKAELRAYDHLAEFKALPGLPVYRL